MATAGIILAAGFSRRLGRPKQWVRLGELTLLERALQTALAAELHPIFLVSRRELEDPQTSSGQGYRTVLNEAAEEGLASSVRAGITAAVQEEVAGAVLMTCDQVLLTATHLQALSACPDAVMGSCYGGRKGVPAYFPSAYFPRLLELRGDAGARELLRDQPCVQAEELLLDLDTEADVAEAATLFGDQRP